MRKAIISILLLLLLLSSIPASGHRKDPPPSDALRDIEPEVTSRGFVFEATISFTAPRDDVFVDEGNGGQDWFIPGEQDGFLLFQIVEYEASPTPESFDGRGLWVWDDDAFDRGDTIRLTYTVLVDAAVEYGTYRVLGSVGLEHKKKDDRATIQGDAIIEVSSPTVEGATDNSTYEPGEEVAFRAAVRYPDGSPGTSGTVLARVEGKDPVVLEESPGNPGVYEGALTLAPDESPGSRLVRFRFTDDKGNVATDLGSIEVLSPRPPPTLDIIARPLKPVFELAEPVVIRAEANLSDAGPVSGATLVATFNRTAGVFPMEELAIGLYEVVFGPVNLTGEWEVRVTGSFEGVTGSAMAAFEVVESVEPPPPPPGTLDIVVTPLKPVFTVGEEVIIRAEANLSGVGPVSGATLVAVFNRTAGAFPMEELAIGLYEVVLGPANLTGMWEVLVSGSFENATGTDKATFEVVEPVDPPPPPPPPLPELTVQSNATETAYDRLEIVSLRAETRLNGVLSSVSSVWVSVLDLGRLNFVGVGVGQYEVSFPLPEDFPLGIITLEVEALSNVTLASTTLAFTVHPTPLALDVELDRQAYEISEIARFTVFVTYVDTRSAEARGTAFVQPTDTGLVLTRAAKGVLSGSFVIPPGARLGSWNIFFEVRDPYGNEGVQRAETEIVPATFTVGLVADPSSAARLTEVNLRADVTYPAGSPVLGAQVTLLWPSGELSLEESTTGVYRGRLLLGRDFPLGLTHLTVHATHRDGQGEKATSLLVGSTSLHVQIAIAPASVVAGETLQIRATATYGDGEVLREGIVRSRIRDSSEAPVTTVDLVYDAGSGAFVGLWRSEASTPPGTYALNVEVEDPFENRGQGGTTFRVEQVDLPPDPDADKIEGIDILSWAAVLILILLPIAALLTYAVRRGGS